MKTFLINWAIAFSIFTLSKEISDTYVSGWLAGIIFCGIVVYVEAKKN